MKLYRPLARLLAHAQNRINASSNAIPPSGWFPSLNGERPLDELLDVATRDDRRRSATVRHRKRRGPRGPKASASQTGAQPLHQWKGLSRPAKRADVSVTQDSGSGAQRRHGAEHERRTGKRAMADDQRQGNIELGPLEAELGLVASLLIRDGDQGGSGGCRSRVSSGLLGRDCFLARRAGLGAWCRDEPVGCRGVCPARVRVPRDPRPLLLADAHRDRTATPGPGSARPGSAHGARRFCGAVPCRRRAWSQGFIFRRGRSSSTGGSCCVIERLAAPLRFEPGTQPLRLGGAGYRGALVVRRARGGLMVVNVLPLDRYLRGVVPWEVPKGWHEATYEAQAVAARSYTLATLHPGKNFDLFPDQRSQAVRRHSRRASADESCDRCDRRPGARLARPDHPGVLLLQLGRQNVVRARCVAARAAGAIPRLGRRSVRLHLAASCLADVGAQRRAESRASFACEACATYESSTTPPAAHRRCAY